MQLAHLGLEGAGPVVPEAEHWGPDHGREIVAARGGAGPQGPLIRRGGGKQLVREQKPRQRGREESQKSLGRPQLYGCFVQLPLALPASLLCAGGLPARAPSSRSACLPKVSP